MHLTSVNNPHGKMKAQYMVNYIQQYRKIINNVLFTTTLAKI